MDEIPRTYEPDFRTLPHYPEGSKPILKHCLIPGETYEDLPGVHNYDPRI